MQTSLQKSYVKKYRYHCCSKVYESILDVVGNTPLVKLNKIPIKHGLECEIYVKCEFMNPSGSIKDRIALSLIDDAVKNGVVNDTTEFVESTSGNTGIGIALKAAIMGNKCTIVTTDKSSDEKANTMRLLGSEVISLKTTKSPTVIARQIKDANPDTVVMVSQFDNDINPKTHYEHTAEEILSALPNIDMVAMGAGTGGTFSGISAKIKSVNSKCVIVGADPDGSTMFNVQGPSHPFLVEGIGGSRIPITLDKSLLDEVEVVTDEETFLMARELVKLEGILCGGSSGTAMVAAIKAAKKHNFGLGKRIVVIMPDGIRNYMSKFVSDQWMEAHLFKEPPQHTMVWWKDPITNLVVYNNYPNINTNSTCEDALLTMVSANDGDVAIVVNDKGWLVGAVSRDSFRHNATNPTKLPQEDSEDFNFQDPVTDHLVKNCYTLTKNGKKGIPTIGLISRILDITPFVIVGTTEKSAEEENFRPEFVVTGNDVLNYIYEHSK